jgi:L-ascorbate metabolism protein UlaG (beta-lactamase superfamily)
MKGDKQLRLSLFAVPDVSIGRAPLTPQNCQFDARRVEYLDGMVAYLESVFADLRLHHSRSDALASLEKVVARLPYSELVKIDPDGTPVVAAIPGARDRIVFDHDRLRVAILDGLNRRPESPMIPVGRDSPELAHLVSKLARGMAETALAKTLRAGTVDTSPAIASLRALNLLEEVDPPASIVPPALCAGREDRLTWLGHAAVLFQTSRASICVDPFLRPHIKWTEEEKKTCFSDSFGDRRFFEPYGPGLTQLSPAQLPPLDAVFVTHQDTDHCNLGVLMMLPEDLPIVVPDYRRDRPWEVDLVALIRKVLGRKRKVIRLKHGQTITFGDIRATAFPFFAEMPSSLTTSWNCYLFETARSAVACTADSAITDESVDFLSRRLGRKRKPFALCARLLHRGKKTPGYRDEAENIYNFTRLWAWYMPIWDLFQPVEESGISESRFSTLARKTNLKFYLPYAMGSAPWFRIADVKDPLHMPIASLSARELHDVAEKLKTISDGAALFPGRFAEPFSLAGA